MDFIDKKEELASLIEMYIENSENEAELMRYVSELKEDLDFANKELFNNIFSEFEKYLPELSNKELKQRVLMIKGYME